MPRTADPETRTRVLDAADRLLARHGFRRMTIEAVAAEACRPQEAMEVATEVAEKNRKKGSRLRSGTSPE